MLDQKCFEPPESIANADMDGIAVAVASESGPIAGTYFWTLTSTPDARCYSKPLFA
jgi:hypothetical protein